MSFEHLVSDEREDFVDKIYIGIYNTSTAGDTTSNDSDDVSKRETCKDTFLSLVVENEELLENEKDYCKERFMYEFELDNATGKLGRQRECHNCKSTRYSDRFCENCISLHLEELFNTWTSGNDVIDNFLQKCQKLSSLPGHIMEWIQFDQFEDIEYLAKGGFGSIYTATWIRGRIFDYDEDKKEFTYFGPQFVTIKVLNNSTEPGENFFEEALNYCKIKSGTLVPCYGVTKFLESNNYAIVLNYIPEGDLRSYLGNNHSSLTLKDRITMFYHLCLSIKDIHAKGLIHCDLHGGNILVQEGICFLTDLGLCGPVDDRSTNKTYGIIPYIAPEVLRGNKNTKESDVYSIGMLMWEIFSGRPPFDDRAHDLDLAFQICDGLRPPILSNMPEEYVKILRECWDTDPSKRPTIEELCGFADDYLTKVYKMKNLDNFNNVDVNFQQIHKSHPSACHSSRILDDNIAKYVTLQLGLELGPVCDLVSEIEGSVNNDNVDGKDVEKIKEVDEINENDKIVEGWNQVKANDLIKTEV